MADHRGIAAAASSIERLIELGFDQAQPVPGRSTQVNRVRTDDFDPSGTELTTAPALTLFLYRVEFNKTLRAAWSAVGHQDGESHLPLDLHFLLTAWGDNAEHEYQILGRAMQSLEDIPILSGALLDPAADWSANEAIQVCLADLSTEDVMRIFDSLPIDYKLSVPYVARTVVIDGGRRDIAPAVTTLIPGVASEVER